MKRILKIKGNKPKVKETFSMNDPVPEKPAEHKHNTTLAELTERMRNTSFLDFGSDDDSIASEDDWEPDADDDTSSVRGRLVSIYALKSSILRTSEMRRQFSGGHKHLWARFHRMVSIDREIHIVEHTDDGHVVFTIDGLTDRVRRVDQYTGNVYFDTEPLFLRAPVTMLDFVRDEMEYDDEL